MRVQEEREERFRLLNVPPTDEPQEIPQPMTQADREILFFNFALLRSLLSTDEGTIDPTVILDVSQLPSRFLDEDMIRQIIGHSDLSEKNLNTNALNARVHRHYSIAAELLALQATTTGQALANMLCDYVFESIQNTWAAIRYYHTHLMDIPESCIPDIMSKLVGAIRSKWWSRVITGKYEWARDNRLPVELVWFLVASNPEFRISQINKFAAEPYDNPKCESIEKWDSIRAQDRA